jgi:hypothetical protein
MSEMADERLSKAFRLIEADELSAARAILDGVLAGEPDNADAWWLYAHAVSDPADAQRALDNVLRIDPMYPGAAELAQELGMVAAEPPKPLPRISPISTATVPAAMPEAMPDFPETDEDLPNLDDGLEDASRRSLIRGIAVVLAVLLILVILGLVLLNRRGTQPIATPTQVAVAISPTADINAGALSATGAGTEIVTSVETEVVAVFPPTVTGAAETEEAPTDVPTRAAATITRPPTDIPTQIAAAVTEEPTKVSAPVATEAPTERPQIAATVEPTLEDEGIFTQEAFAVTQAVEPGVTDIPVTPAATDEDFTNLMTALSDFMLPADPIGTAQTDLGTTFVTSVCTSAGSELRRALPEVMRILAEQAATSAAGVDAIGARMLNCDTGKPLAIVVVAQETAAQFAQGSISEADYEFAWRPQ